MDFLYKYQNKKNYRFDLFNLSLQIAKKRNFKIFVETGVSRGKKFLYFFSRKNWKDGMSTMMFSEYSSIYNAHLYTCDISMQNIKSAQRFCRKFKKNVTFICEDSLNFLQNFNKKIDFLYLDSLDGYLEEANEHQLKEIQIAKEKLSNNALILLDDKNTKSKLSMRFLSESGFKIIQDTENQVLYSKHV